MKLFKKGKDGGPLSTVTGYWLIELKKLFSVALLKFEDGSRDEYHSHAFNCLSWVLSGSLREENLDGSIIRYKPSIIPVLTKKETFHRVFSLGTSWVLTFRGPWEKQWVEYDPSTEMLITLEDGRKVVDSK